MPDTELEAWLAERRSIHAAATEGPWRSSLLDGMEHSDGSSNYRGGLYPNEYGRAPIFVTPGIDKRNATAIADAHNHLPALIAMVEAVLGVLNENTPPDPCQPDDPAGMCPDCSLIREIRRALEAARKAVSER